MLSDAAKAVRVWPVRTNAGFLARAAAHPDFVGGRIDTGFIERHSEALVPAAEPDEAVLQAAAAAILPDDGDMVGALAGFRLNAPANRAVSVDVNGTTHLVERTAGNGNAAPVCEQIGGEQILFVDGTGWAVGEARADHGDAGGGAADGVLVAPMPGRIIAIEVAAGDSVTKGQKLLVMEAMKMEQSMLAPFDGTVAEMELSVGAQVTEGSVLVRIEKEEED